MNSKESAPELEKTHSRQAFWSLGLGIGVWGFSVIAFVIMSIIAAAMQANGTEPTVAGAVFILALLPSPLIALFGIGAGAAALRARGSHMLLATTGFLLSSLYMGGLIGFFTFAIWVAS